MRMGSEVSFGAELYWYFNEWTMTFNVGLAYLYHAVMTIKLVSS